MRNHHRAHRSRPAPRDVTWGRPNAPHRRRLEALVRRVYGRVHDARITHFHHLLLGLEGPRGELLGVIGATRADGARRLFLEAYLDEPVERVLSTVLARPVLRQDIVEVGNLASLHPGCGRRLVTTMANHLDAAGLVWTVFTATATVRRTLEALGTEIVDLGPVDGRRVPGGLEDWGHYYSDDPRLVAVRLAELCATARRSPELSDELSAIWERARAAATPLRRLRDTA